MHEGSSTESEVKGKKRDVQMGALTQWKGVNPSKPLLAKDRYKVEMKYIIFISTLLSSAVSQSILSSTELPEGPCSIMCACTEKDGVLYLNCEERNIDKMAEIKLSPATAFHLNLCKNNLVELLPEDLVGLKNAVSLNLGGNSIQQLEPGLFSALGFLKKLHINRNFLVTIRADTFQGLVNLEYLQADTNFIRIVEPGAFNKLVRLKVLILNDNEIGALPSNVFRFVPLTHLDLRGNRLMSLPYLGLLEHIGRIAEFLLDDNNWLCNCHILPLKMWKDNIPAQCSVSEVVCGSPPHLKGSALSKVKKSDLCPSHGEITLEAPLKFSYMAVTPVSKVSKNFPKLRKSEHEAKVTRPSLASVSGVICTERCSCFNSPTADFLIHCEDKGLQRMSDLGFLHQSPTHLVLTGNVIQGLMQHDFASYESLQLLNLANNQIDSIDNGTFASLGQLQKLYLNGNRLIYLFRGMFAGLGKLEHLFLEYNIIESIQPVTFAALTNLKILSLNNNRLKTFPSHIFHQVPIVKLNIMNNVFRQLPVFNVLDQLDSLRLIFLDNNPWDCTCELLQFKQWVEALSKDTVVGNILCQSPRKLAKTELRTLSHKLMCHDLPTFSPAPTKLIGQRATVAPTPASGEGGFRHFFAHTLPLSVLILSLLIFFLLVVFSAAGIVALFVHQKHRQKKSQAEVRPGESATAKPQRRTSHEVNTSGQTVQSMTARPYEDPTQGSVVKVCQSPTCWVQREESGLDEHNRSRSNCPRRCLLGKEKCSDSSPTGRPLKFMIMKEYPSEFVTLGSASSLYQNAFERQRELQQLDITEYLKNNMPQLQPDVGTRNQHEGLKLKQTLVYTRPQAPNEYFDLKPSLHTDPDYLEVVERESTIN